MIVHSTSSKSILISFLNKLDKFQLKNFSSKSFNALVNLESTPGTNNSDKM